MLRIATRKSPLALAQTAMVAAVLRDGLGEEIEELRLTTTGDKQTQWSLEKQGGKGLFTKELEEALLSGQADFAVHSAKDLPGEMPEGLAVAGYLPRGDARDVLVRRKGIEQPSTIATGSPRRRQQLAALFPMAVFSEIRGNVDTRLNKIAVKHEADATMLAAAGLARLGISSWDNLDFIPLPFEQLVPAVGQAAIAVQCRVADVARLQSLLDAETARHVAVERAFQRRLGAGCHTAFAAHGTKNQLHLFHEACGAKQFSLTPEDLAAPGETADRVLRTLGLWHGAGI